MIQSKKPVKRPLSPTDVGFVFDLQNRVIGLNPNMFARYITTRFKLCYSPQKLMYEYTDEGVFQRVDEEALKSKLYKIVNKFVKDSWRETFENAYIKALKNEVYSSEEMNSQRNLLNLENFMLNIDTMEWYEHDPQYRSSIRIPVEYDPKAKCPMFKKFLQEIFENDKQLIAITEEIIGYCMTTETKAQKAILLYGTGGNGKSILCYIINKICGTANVSAVSLNELGNPFARLDLVGKTVNLVTETEVKGVSFNTELFKAIVAGDEIRAEIKGGATVKFRSTVKIVAAMNSLPFAKDQSYGLSRRLLILPFERQFTGDEIDVDLQDKLEQELPGIFNLALRGLERLRRQKYRFTESSKVTENLLEYQESISPITVFVDEILLQGSTVSRVSNKMIRRLFGVWCLERGHKRIAEMSDTRFHILLKHTLRDKRIAFTSEKTGGERYLKGIELNKNGQETLETIPEYRPSKLKTVTEADDSDLLEDE